MVEQPGRQKPFLHFLFPVALVPKAGTVAQAAAAAAAAQAVAKALVSSVDVFPTPAMAVLAVVRAVAAEKAVMVDGVEEAPLASIATTPILVP
jgi:hypothetical protein